MLKIGPTTIDPPLFLAPMAGITDRDFRLLVRRIGGVGLVAMEFLSSRGLVRGEKQWTRLMHFEEEERPISIQIYGSDVATMAEAARIVETLKPDVCDINMGCPANKILKGCAGAALMGDLRLAEAIIRQVRRTLSIPLTVKFRLGLDEQRQNYLELGRICEDQGADAVAMHARFARQGYRGEADWSHLAKLKESLSIPVIGNGDVNGPEDAHRMLAETGCDGIMIGRGATKNPWIFRQIASSLSGGSVPEPTLKDRRDLILEHFRTVIRRDDPKTALHKVRTFTGKYSQGLPRGQELRRRIQGIETAEAFLDLVEEHFREIIRQEERAA